MCRYSSFCNSSIFFKKPKLVMRPISKKDLLSNRAYDWKNILEISTFLKKKKKMWNLNMDLWFSFSFILLQCAKFFQHHRCRYDSNVAHRHFYIMPWHCEVNWICVEQKEFLLLWQNLKWQQKSIWKCDCCDILYGNFLQFGYSPAMLIC